MFTLWRGRQSPKDEFVLRALSLSLGAKARTRTADRTIFSRELYQLSYLGRGCVAGTPEESVGDRGLEPLTSTV